MPNDKVQVTTPDGEVSEAHVMSEPFVSQSEGVEVVKPEEKEDKDAPE